MGRLQLGLPRLRVITGRASGPAMSPDDTPPNSTRGIAVMVYSPACMKKAPRVGAKTLRSRNRQAAVRNSFSLISSFARSQSSSS
jgi:hypothetical protein